MRTYDPPESRKYKKRVEQSARLVCDEPIDVPVELDVVVYREPPKSWSKKKKKEALDGLIVPETRPDLDNYLKSILDGLNEVAFTDDNLVCRIVAEKRYGEEKAIIEIRELDL